jgi:hypothetical protein
MKGLKEAVEEFNTLIEHQQWETALNTFYDENIISVDNEGESLHGLDKLKNALKEFDAKTSDRFVIFKHSIISDDMSVTEWHYIFTHKDWGRFDYDQLSLQRWKDGKIKHERHHYKTDKL